MGMTNEQFKAYVAILLDEIEEAHEMIRSENSMLMERGHKKLEKLKVRLHEALER